MEEIVVTKEGVTKLHKDLNSSKALGPVELHPRVPKGLATELGPVFALLSQQSTDTRTCNISNEWSLVNIHVCLLFKDNDMSFDCNYHPLPLTWIPCKLLEQIFCVQMP